MILPLALLIAAAVCPDKDRAFTMAFLEEEPAQHVIADIRGNDADAFLDKIGGPVGTGMSVMIADMPDPAVLFIVIFDAADCVVAAGPMPIEMFNRILGRIKA